MIPVKTTNVRTLLALLALACALLGCAGPGASPAPTAPVLAKELVMYNWAGYMPQSVLDAFAAEYGVTVDYQVYETQYEAMAGMQAGSKYDVVLMGIEFIPQLIQEGLLAEIDYGHVPNFKNIAADFRDLAYDPENRHSIPFAWGTTGLLVRSDEVEELPTRWADLFDPRYRGKVAMWDLQDTAIQVALKSLGYSANSEDPAEVNAAVDRLIELKPGLLLWPGDQVSIVSPLADGRAVLAVGWAYDALTAAEADPNIVYILPDDGTMLWCDAFVIPANSPNRETAELFLDFLLRPAIGGQLISEIYYATANEAALPFVVPEVANDPLIFPGKDALVDAEVILPRSAQGERLQAEAWERFLAAEP